MELVADRFVMTAPIDGANASYAIDLATTTRVRLIFSRAGTPYDQREWLVACDDQQRVRRFGAPRLLDYGHIGQTQRFEAWIDEQASSLAGETGRDRPPVRLIDRPLVRSVAAMFEVEEERRPRAIACWGPRGSGRTTAVEQLSRMARLRGFVPVDTTVLDACSAALRDRTLFVIDRDDARRDLTPWLRVLLRSPRAHICLVIRTEEMSGVDGFAIDRIDPDSLVASVDASDLDARTARRVRRAAEQAHGLPARFVRTIWRAGTAHRRQPDCGLSRVAEQPAEYGGPLLVPAIVEPLTQAEHATRAWPTPGEVSSLRRRAAMAGTLIADGRFAPGIRLMRQAMAALARRDAWSDAVACALALADALLDRGRPRDVLRLLGDARGWFDRDGASSSVIDAAICSGAAWIDMARLEDAERVLSGALAAARAARDRLRAQAAGTALSRCLFWRGQFDEALSLVDGDPEPARAADAIRRLRALARAAVARADSARALSALDAARRLAAETGDGRWRSDVAYTTAVVHLALGDFDAVDADTAECITQARAARRPLRGFDAGVLRAEADRRRGRFTDPARLAALARLAKAAPPLARARYELLRTLVGAPGDRGAVRRHLAASGLKGLDLFAGGTLRVAGPSAADPFVEDVLGILQVCQHADDEGVVLADVCARVRKHIHAGSVAFMAAVDRRLESVAGDGPRMDADIGERAISARVTIAPHRIGERLEAAAPVQYGGNVIGALGARWTAGTPYDLSRAGTVLSMAAAAAAPVLSSVLVRRAHSSPAAMLDLLGSTPAILELRRAIEHAAPAPFPVLIEGESGSGKELVARAIHRCGPRRDRPLATLNCAALPDELVEAELFGHVRGSFTGAAADRPGVFEEAHGGTLFLDEVGELSLRAQAKLLRVIQEGELRRIGENVSRRVDVRIVCATNRHLRAEADAGRFRQDLLYRLDVVRITVPPLRERREDVAVLVEHYWTEATRRVASRATLAAETRALLASYDWPGNIRELQNVLAALAVRSPKRGVVLPAALPVHVADTPRPSVWRLDAARRSFEEGFVRAALARSGGHRARAAADLGVTRQGLTKLMTRLGIE